MLPERHLGLIPTVEGQTSEEYLERLITQIESTIAIPEILRVAELAEVSETKPTLFPPANKKSVVSIAVARDRAFSFYYQDSLDLLEAWGSELVPFSPLEDTTLPAATSGVYIGGGFPELYAKELASNAPMKMAISTAVKRGIPAYAECGGLMYMGASIHDLKGKEHLMTRVLPISTRIDKPRLSLGYRTVEAISDGPLLCRCEMARGHEFHWSVINNSTDTPNAYRITDGDQLREGFQRGNLLASYIHLHLGSLPTMAPRFVETCRQFRHMHTTKRLP